MVEVQTEVPVTELKEITRMIPITTEVPVHTTKRIETTMPVDTMVPVETTKMVQTNVNVESTVPVQGMKQIHTNIGIQSTVPVQGSKIVGANIPVETFQQERIITEHLDNIEHVRVNEGRIHHQQQNVILQETPIRNEVKEVTIIKEERPRHYENIQSEVILNNNLNTQFRSFDINTVRGLTSCKRCHGIGYLKSKTGKYGKFKACKDCVKASGKCYFCNNEGLLIENPNQRCACLYGKSHSLKMK